MGFPPSIIYLRTNLVSWALNSFGVPLDDFLPGAEPQAGLKGKYARNLADRAPDCSARAWAMAPVRAEHGGYGMQATRHLSAARFPGNHRRPNRPDRAGSQATACR